MSICMDLLMPHMCQRRYYCFIIETKCWALQLSFCRCRSTLEKVKIIGVRVWFGILTFLDSTMADDTAPGPSELKIPIIRNPKRLTDKEVLTFLTRIRSLSETPVVNGVERNSQRTLIKVMTLKVTLNLLLINQLCNKMIICNG